MSGEHPNACSLPCSFKFANLHLNPNTVCCKTAKNYNLLRQLKFEPDWG